MTSNTSTVSLNHVNSLDSKEEMIPDDSTTLIDNSFLFKNSSSNGKTCLLQSCKSAPPASSSSSSNNDTLQILNYPSVSQSRRSSSSSTFKGSKALLYNTSDRNRNNSYTSNDFLAYYTPIVGMNSKTLLHQKNDQSKIYIGGNDYDDDFNEDNGKNALNNDNDFDKVLVGGRQHPDIKSVKTTPLSNILENSEGSIHSSNEILLNSQLDDEDQQNLDAINTVLPLRPQQQDNKTLSCGFDLKVLCRLIASHQHKPQPGSVISFTVDGEIYRFKVCLSIDLGQNIRCLVFERAIDTSFEKISTSAAFQKKNTPILFDPSELIFAFNWFSPRGIWDYVSLGLRLLMNPGIIEKEFGLCSEMSMSHATQFFNHSDIKELLHELTSSNKSSSVLNHKKQLISTSVVKRVTLTGFSMGASTAHAFALLLKEVKKIPQEIRCVGFGSPRPGNEEFTRWFKKNLTSDSMNIILAREETITENKQERCQLQSNTLSEEEEEEWVEGEKDSIRPQDYNNHHTNACLNACNSQNLGLRGCLTPPILHKTDTEQISTYYNSSSNISPFRYVMYDPVARTPNSSKGFDIHPNAYVIIQQKSGILSPVTTDEREYLKILDNQHSADTSTLSALLSLAIRGSPFNPTVSRGLDQLHSVLKYYEAMMNNN